MGHAGVAERKNIFGIGRRGREGDEDQLTEMLAFLWQEQPRALNAWLDSVGLALDSEVPHVQTQLIRLGSLPAAGPRMEPQRGIQGSPAATGLGTGSQRSV